jgi:hypothetical protein
MAGASCSRSNASKAGSTCLSTRYLIGRRRISRRCIGHSKSRNGAQSAAVGGSSRQCGRSSPSSSATQRAASIADQTSPLSRLRLPARGLERRSWKSAAGRAPAREARRRRADIHRRARTRCSPSRARVPTFDTATTSARWRSTKAYRKHSRFLFMPATSARLRGKGPFRWSLFRRPEDIYKTDRRSGAFPANASCIAGSIRAENGRVPGLPARIC